MSVGAVEEAFDISPMTARRDLGLLAEGGHARRTHGGAALPELAAHEDSFQSRVGQDVEAKRRLGRAVVETIEPGETIFVDCSSSSYYVVREILESGLRVTLLTNCLPLMTLIGGADAPQVELIGLGAGYRKLTQSFVGAQALRTIESFFADRVIFSCKGIERQGHLTDPDRLEAEVKRAMISHSRAVSLVADTHKFQASSAGGPHPIAAATCAFTGGLRGLPSLPAEGGRPPLGIGWRRRDQGLRRLRVALAAQ